MPVGTTVTWVNGDDVPHTVVATDKSFRSKVLDTLFVDEGFGTLDADTTALGAPADRPTKRGTAYVGRGLSAENLVVFSATVAAGDPSGVLLIDGPDALPRAAGQLGPLLPADLADQTIEHVQRCAASPDI